MLQKNETSESSPSSSSLSLEFRHHLLLSACVIERHAPAPGIEGGEEQAPVSGDRPATLTYFPPSLLSMTTLTKPIISLFFFTFWVPNGERT